MNAYRRHIIIDNIHRIIYIEVQNDLKGYPKQKEYENIVAGLWPDYVPREFKTQLKEAAAGGYKVQPMICDGAQSEAFYVLQLAEIRKSFIFKPSNN
jgi:protein-L-isoaspartate O-methyltransferase